MTGIELPRLIVADLDGTLLHDSDTFEGRFMTQRTVDTINRMHDRGVRFAVATARPVSTALELVNRLPVDACAYLNGALIDFNPSQSDYDMLTAGKVPSDGHVLRLGFSSTRACEVCRFLLEEFPGIRIGIVMNDIRYTNFDVRELWKTQTFRYTDFTDVPDGVADKIIILPQPEQCDRLRTLIPPDFDVSISEGIMWMLMNPLANKSHALDLLCAKLEIPLNSTVTFGDDLIDIAMLQRAGRGVAVANAVPRVLNIADEICPSNNEDGVAQWLEDKLN
ncbi:HAD family hydrolase [Bifidobacterium tissieri]|uniref:HAD family hydrolase n=1 Tax=Bifidobacterium tissieri TaxID=1630162 RepID=A0A5M9ZW83_9BIFI|nr:HAD family hydrolase [Bifidobacterium tissieri]KAA8830837.1 HAD family hydrolase [Bifidobacterium tissieri]KAA8831830.1 HAD family hydrolase [Bifidobacterium tissieri]